MKKNNSYDTLKEVVATLRSPGGCPWDQKQTHESLRKYLLEEVYEVLDAIAEGDMEALKGELGDVLLQVVFHARLAEESGQFTLEDVIQAEVEKMVRRHPHVFGENKEQSMERIAKSWETIKMEEVEHDSRTSVLDGIPKMLPTLARTEKLQDKAVRVGFTWPSLKGVEDKLREEIREFKEAEKNGEIDSMEDEAGDVLFTLIHLLQWHGISAESALRRANAKFESRFVYMEQRMKEQQKNWDSITLEELDAFWEEKKMKEKD